MFVLFSPSCPYCRAEIHDILSNYAGMKSFRFVLVTSDGYTDFKNFYIDNAIKQYPNVICGIDSKGDLSNYMGTNRVPLSTICDKEKKIKTVFLGRMTASEIISALEK
jgi:hypothetical protein